MSLSFCMYSFVLCSFSSYHVLQSNLNSCYDWNLCNSPKASKINGRIQWLLHVLLYCYCVILETQKSILLSLQLSAARWTWWHISDFWVNRRKSICDNCLDEQLQLAWPRQINCGVHWTDWRWRWDLFVFILFDVVYASYFPPSGMQVKIISSFFFSIHIQKKQIFDFETCYFRYF